MQAEALLNMHRHEEAYTGFQNAPVIDVNISAKLFGTTVTTNFLTVQAQVYLASGRLASEKNLYFLLNITAVLQDSSNCLFVSK